MTQMAMRKATKPLEIDKQNEQNLVRTLDRIREEKIPFHEKLPKDSIFYKHLMSNIYTAKFAQQTVQTAKYEENQMKEVGEVIHKVRSEEYGTPEKVKRPARKPSQKEREAMKSLWQELSA
jgi:hypothetical protein